jgi:hypothetical protein
MIIKVEASEPEESPLLEGHRRLDPGDPGWVIWCRAMHPHHGVCSFNGIIMLADVEAAQMQFRKAYSSEGWNILEITDVEPWICP